MQFGSFSIELLETGDFALDGGAMFGVVPKALWTKAYGEPDAENRIPMKARALLIRSGERVILVDTGNGLKFPEKLARMYKIDNECHTLNASLARFGLAPADITDVILTHLHFDHAGGATVLRDGKVEPAFPNAKYYVQKDHYRWAQKPADKDRASFMRDDFEPLAAEGMLELLDGEGELFPGVSLALFHGHTESLQAVKLESEGKKLLYPADLFPTSAHIPVPYVMAYDNAPLVTIEEKKRLLPELAEDGWLVVFEHDGFMGACEIARTEKGFARGKTVTITEW